MSPKTGQQVSEKMFNITNHQGNTDQNQKHKLKKNTDNTSFLMNGFHQEIKKASIGKNVEKLELLCPIDGNVKWYSHYEKEQSSPQNLKIQLSYDPAISTSGYSSKELKSESQRGICTLVFIATLFIIAKLWK